MDEQLIKIQKLLDAAEGNLASARNMLRTVVGKDTTSTAIMTDNSEETVDEKIIEGTFNGEEMITTDGNNYPVPANYASKSKLVEGDGLKLTIADDGSFIFKQIKPIERKSLVGTLDLDGNAYTVLVDGKSYKVLTASITFYKAEPGDQVTIIVPKESDAKWGALENVVSKASQTDGVELVPTETVAEESQTTELPLPEIVEDKLGTEAELSVDTGIDKVILPDESQPLLPVEAPSKDMTVEAPAPTTVEAMNPVDSIPVAKEEPITSDVDVPKIEFPGASENASLSDDQLLENLKNNLKGMSAPTFVSPVTAEAPKPVDSVIAAEQKTNDAQNLPTTTDEPISELEI